MQAGIQQIETAASNSTDESTEDIETTDTVNTQESQRVAITELLQALREEQLSLQEDE